MLKLIHLMRKVGNKPVRPSLNARAFDSRPEKPGIRAGPTRKPTGASRLCFVEFLVALGVRYRGNGDA